MLLSGLPGDVESETEYREQLRGWLDIIESNGGAQKVWVLCDAPESVTLPGKVEGTAQKASRDNFVALGQALAGQTNPLVVIAWGHGGRQGNTAVFHVRGPRLTPVDFKALARRVPQAESRWVLMFCGSGSFAGELAGARRQILSSEHDSMFSSDPVGMPVLLRLTREADPGRPFEELSEAFGSATAAWYTERTLVRTEEPTLWLENEKPRLLAPSSDTNSFASVPPKDTNDVPAKVEALSPTPAAVALPLGTNLPPVWKTIRRVEPRKYLDADAVSLRRRLSYTFADKPAIVTEREEFTQILTPEGKRHGEFDVHFSPPFEDISFLDCEVLSPEGKLVRLDPEAIRESHEASVGDYQAGRRKFFSLPGVVPGAVLHVRFRTKWEKFPLPHVSMEIPLGSETPVLDATVEVSVPKESPFHFAFEQVPAPDPSIGQTDYGTTYSWHLENLPSRTR